MREILFRGKTTHSKKWIYGNYIQETLGDSIYSKVEDILENIDSGSRYIIPETLGQYTGIKDKNGTKIFEGDICEHIDRDNYPRPFAVEWIEDYACFVFVDKGDYFRNYYFQKKHMENIQVIGNIYDNPELIQNDK